MSTNRKKVKAWLEVQIGDVKFGCAEEIEVPEGCFDDNGELIEEDVIEYIEEWVQDRARWGAQLIDFPGEGS